MPLPSPCRPRDVVDLLLLRHLLASDAASDAGLTVTMDDAIAELNDWIDKVDAARADKS